MQNFILNYYLYLILILFLGCKRGSSINSEYEIRKKYEILKISNEKIGIFNNLYNIGSQGCMVYYKIPPYQALLGNCSTNEHQKFKFTNATKGKDTYNLTTHSEKYCLEAIDLNRSDKFDVRFEPCDNSENQKIVLNRSDIDKTSIKLHFVKSDKCLNILENKRKQGAIFHLSNCRKGTSQDFFIEKFEMKQSKLPKYIWTFWDKGYDEMPAFYKSNVNHWNKLVNINGSEDWIIRVTNLIKDDPNYIGNFIDLANIPSLNFIASKIGTKPFESKLNKFVIYSDFIRLELLYKFGGVWIDPSIMLHDDLSSIESSLSQLNRFEIAGYTSRSQSTSDLLFTDSLENFFIAANPSTKLLASWRKNFREYWDKKLKNTPIAQHVMYNGSEGFKLDTRKFSKLADYLNQHIALKYTLEKNRNFIDQILILGDVGKDEKGPFSLLNYIDWDDESLLHLKTQGIDLILDNLEDVKMSKFPSENSKNIRDFTKNNLDYFYNINNIFGRLNYLD